MTTIKRGPGRPPRNAHVKQDVSIAQEVDHDDMIHEEDDYDEQWEEGMLLAAPPARAGYHQKWVRVKLDGAPDMRNIIRHRNMRYKPVKASQSPNYESTMFGDDDVIGNEEMVLMERSLKLHEKRVQKQRQSARGQMEQVQRDVFKQTRPGDGFGSVQYDTDKTTVNTGRPAPVAEDPAL